MNSWLCLPPGPPPPCSCCGAEPLTDHAENCNVLQALRSTWPEVVDRNGMPWYLNYIKEKDAKIARLESELRTLREAMGT